jgi:hypothetical protein
MLLSCNTLPITAMNKEEHSTQESPSQETGILPLILRQADSRQLTHGIREVAGEAVIAEAARVHVNAVDHEGGPPCIKR